MKFNDNFLPALLALHRLHGMGPVKFKQILSKIGTLTKDMNLVEILFSKKDDCLFFPGKANWKSVEKDLLWAEGKNQHLITIFDKDYPALLKEIHAAPPILFVAGNIDLLSTPQIAIVGSRNPSSHGRETACYFANKLSEHGLCITSGLACGIDGASHQGAILAGGETIAVLANGLDEIYPLIHKKLSFEIREQGALVSEFPIGIPPMSSHFPRRNRIISGLAMGTLVVEATLNSGSLITAKYALEQGREIFAIPGSIYSSQSRGCHALIRQGAKLVETPQDVLEEMESLLKYMSQLNDSGNQMSLRQTAKTEETGSKRDSKLNVLNLGKTDDDPIMGNLKASSASNRKRLEGKVLTQIGFERTTIDTLLGRTGLTLSEVSSILLELELKGSIEPYMGGYLRVKA